jgi:hypothetical protein
VRGTNVCMTHGAAAPQVRAKAALRLAMMMDPALKVYADILKDKDHPDAFRVAKDVLDRNKLFGLGTPEDAKPDHSLMVTTQVNTNVAGDDGRGASRLPAVAAGTQGAAPKEAPKAIEGIVGIVAR